MGVSAAGYVGGKLVRKAGPKITAIDAALDPATGILDLTITGAALSQSASFILDRVQLSPSLVHTDDSRPDPGPKDETSNDPDFFQSLDLPIDTPNDSWLTADLDHKFTIVNPDGQKAVWNYRIPPAKTATATATPASHVLVLAPGFSAKDSFEYEVGGVVNKITGAVLAKSAYQFDVATGATAGQSIRLKLTKAQGGQPVFSNNVTVL